MDNSNDNDYLLMTHSRSEKPVIQDIHNGEQTALPLDQTTQG